MLKFVTGQLGRRRWFVLMAAELSWSSLYCFSVFMLGSTVSFLAGSCVASNFWSFVEAEVYCCYGFSVAKTDPMLIFFDASRWLARVTPTRELAVFLFALASVSMTSLLSSKFSSLGATSWLTWWVLLPAFLSKGPWWESNCWLF